MSSPAPILSAQGLHKSYGSGPARVHVLRGLGLVVERGEFISIMGPSGCGKSTLLHVLGLMTAPDEGELTLDGQRVTGSTRQQTLLRRRSIGFVFQRFNLLGTLGAMDNVRLSLRIRGVRADGYVEELFDTMGIAHVARRKPGQMSIGEQQRVAVVRALAHRPAVLLADEPTGSLDTANSAALLETFRTIHRDCGQTIVMITHSPAAAATADRTVHMRDGLLHEGSANAL